MPVPLIATAGSAVGKIAGGLKRLTVVPADKRAKAEVEQLLPRALAGDQAAIDRLRQGATGAATTKAKLIFQQALARLPQGGLPPSAAQPPKPTEAPPSSNGETVMGLPKTAFYVLAVVLGFVALKKGGIF